MKEKIIKIFLILITIISIWLLYLKQKKQKGQIVLGFAGDTMLGRLVNKKIDHAGYKYVWGNALPLLKKTDINIINLETTLTKSEKRVPKVFNYKAAPDKVKSLQEANIHVVNLANNHMLDFSDEGLIETVRTLDNAKIKHVGAGKNIQDARKPVVIEKNGIKVGIIGYTDYPQDWKATEAKPGTNIIKIGDIKQIEQDIKNVRPNVDILILTIHWGPNKRQRPTEEFQDFAHQIIDAGVDIIHGHSAHIFQGIEVTRKNKLILYDTGDFVDDYMVGPVTRNDWSFFYQVTVDKSGIKKLKLTPLLINNMQVNVATGKEKENMIKHLKTLSEELGTKINDNLKLTTPINKNKKIN